LLGVEILVLRKIKYTQLKEFWRIISRNNRVSTMLLFYLREMSSQEEA
jgi:hypothetical protein